METNSTTEIGWNRRSSQHSRSLSEPRYPTVLTSCPTNHMRSSSQGRAHQTFSTKIAPVVDRTPNLISNKDSLSMHDIDNMEPPFCGISYEKGQKRSKNTLLLACEKSDPSNDKEDNISEITVKRPDNNGNYYSKPKYALPSSKRRTRDTLTSTAGSSHSLSKSQADSRSPSKSKSPSRITQLHHAEKQLEALFQEPPENTRPSLRDTSPNGFKSGRHNNDIDCSKEIFLTARKSSNLSKSHCKQVTFSPSCENNECSRTDSNLDQQCQGGTHYNDQSIGGGSSSREPSCMKFPIQELSRSSRLTDFVNYVKSSSYHTHRGMNSKRGRVGHEYLMTKINDSIYEHIFSFLDNKDVRCCSYVCKLWMKICMQRLGGIHVFNGKWNIWTLPGNRKRMKHFVQRIREKEEKFRHPYKIKFFNVTQAQMKYLSGLYSDSFRLSVRHMTSITLTNCEIKWATLIDLLMHFENLKMLSDENSYHYSFRSILLQVGKAQQDILKTADVNTFKDSGVRKVRCVRIARKTINQELINYIILLRLAIREFHEFALVIGSNDKRKDSRSDFLSGKVNTEDFAEFTANVRLLMIRHGIELRKISFKWSNRMDEEMFGKCMEVIRLANNFDSLSDMTLAFDRNSMKTPKNLEVLLNFLEINCEKSLRIFRLSVIVLNVHWRETIEQLENMVRRRNFTTIFELGIEASDSFGQAVVKLNKKLLESHIFVIYMTSLCVHVGTNETSTVSELIPHEINQQYRRMKKVHVHLEAEEESTFNSFNVDLLSHNFPNLTELFLEDEWQNNFTNLKTRRKQLGRVVLGDSEVQLIGAILLKLRVLKLWCNLENLTDYGVTGICPDEIHLLQAKQIKLFDESSHDLRSSFSSLTELREISLRGVGTGVTSISARHGFYNLPFLKYLEIAGTFKISGSARRTLRKKLEQNDPEYKLKLSSY